MELVVGIWKLHSFCTDFLQYNKYVHDSLLNWKEMSVSVTQLIDRKRNREKYLLLFACLNTAFRN